MPRPALVISQAGLGPDNLLTWALMITNARRDPWPGDVDIPSAEQIGLLIPSKIRTAKISPVETKHASLIGRLDSATLVAVQQIVREAIG